MFYINSKGEVYIGDKQPGDRVATQTEIDMHFSIVNTPIEETEETEEI